MTVATETLLPVRHPPIVAIDRSKRN
jgi:hypothetical protein